MAPRRIKRLRLLLFLLAGATALASLISYFNSPKVFFPAPKGHILELKLSWGDLQFIWQKRSPQPFGPEWGGARPNGSAVVNSDRRYLSGAVTVHVIGGLSWHPWPKGDYYLTRRVSVHLLPIALVLGLAALATLAPDLMRRVQRRRAVPGLCTDCGYDLRATPDRCPECGTIPSSANAAESKAAP